MRLNERFGDKYKTIFVHIFIFFYVFGYAPFSDIERFFLISAAMRYITMNNYNI